MDRPIEIDPAALAVLAAFAGRHGLDRDAALRVACAFGGGVASGGGPCGAVTGGLMAIGLAHGGSRANDEGTRERTYAASRAFLERFRREHGSNVCRELLGVDIGTPEGREAAAKEGLFRTRCPRYVRTAARLAMTA
jgi:C_GCAxxG_C_C family probable redox protein